MSAADNVAARNQRIHRHPAPAIVIKQKLRGCKLLLMRPDGPDPVIHVQRRSRVRELDVRLPIRIDRSDVGLVYTVEGCDNLVANNWQTLTGNATFTNTVPGSPEMEEIQLQFWAGAGAPVNRNLRLVINESLR